MSSVSRAMRYVVLALALGGAIGFFQQGSIVGGLALGVFIAIGVTFGLVFFEFVGRVF